MEKAYFEKIYNSNLIDTIGSQLLSDLSSHLKKTTSGENSKTINWSNPEEELQFWRDFLDIRKEADFFQKIINRTTHIHHPKYMGHQVAAPAPVTALTALVGSLLNNGGAVFEMGMAPNAMERVVTDLLCKKMGWASSARGILTSGGSLANLTALLAARRTKVSEDIWNNGLDKSLGVMVCEEAHYCIERAVKIMGLGNRGLIKIPALENFSMDVSQLERYYQKAISGGIEVFAIVGSAPSTATGAYDNLEAIATFAKKHGLWFHVDGAHGGAAIFSTKYKPLLEGVEKADSVVIDGHKMLLMPAITTALLFRNGNDSHNTFSQKADYLLTEVDEEDWYNIGKRSFECTKTMQSLHWFVLLKFYGEELFDRFVTRQYDLAQKFAAMLNEHNNFELATDPMSNIVCFRYVAENLVPQKLNECNAEIRQALLVDGEFYMVQTLLHEKQYLRVSLMNPFTTTEHLEQLLGKIETVAKTLINL